MAKVSSVCRLKNDWNLAFATNHL